MELLLEAEATWRLGGFRAFRVVGPWVLGLQGFRVFRFFGVLEGFFGVFSGS